MIQRIQSVFLLLASLCVSLFLLLPVFTIHHEENIIRERATENVFFLFLSVILLAGSVIMVFLYSNRTLQARVGWVLWGINLILLGLLAYHYYLEARRFQWVGVSWGVWFPVLSAILLLLAIYYINKDEKLIRSLDRLR